MRNQRVKRQFNKQDSQFAHWSVGKNINYLKGYYDFCDITSKDTLLDVACGPGDFTIFAAGQISSAYGIDISDREIEIARKQSEDAGLKNIQFHCADVEYLPNADNSFSIVLCKSAFHHFVNSDRVLREMKRCCEPSGKISIQDIVMYDDDYVNNYFETFDRFIDISHNRTLGISEINRLFQNNTISKSKEFRLDVDLNVNEYIGHALQASGEKVEIKKLLIRGQQDRKLSEFLFRKEGELFFKRPVYLILGTK